MNKGMLTAVAMNALLAFAAVVEAKPIRCDVCRDDMEFRAEAKAAGQGTHLVFSLETGVLQQWYVGPGGVGGGGDPASLPNTRSLVTPMSSPDIVKQTPSPGATEEMRRSRELYIQGGGTIRPVIVVPISMLNVNPDVKFKTVYNFVNDYNMQAQLETAAGRPELISQVTSSGLVAALADLTNLASNYLNLKSTACLQFKIVMTDGSYVVIRVDLDNVNGKYEPNSARTAGGQGVPVTIDQVNGVWTNYAGEDLTPMIAQMSYLGATISYVGAGNHGSVRTISCNGSGTSKVCVVETQIW